MEYLISDICSSIESASDDLSEALQRTAFCFENYLGLDSEAWPSDIKAANFSDSDVARLKLSLYEFIASRSNDFYLGTAVWAYGKIADKKDLDFLIRVLKEHLNSSPQSLYQIMCAIGNTGENIFNRESSSMLDFEKNRSLAMRYLDVKGA